MDGNPEVEIREVGIRAGGRQVVVGRGGVPLKEVALPVDVCLVDVLRAVLFLAVAPSVADYLGCSRVVRALGVSRDDHRCRVDFRAARQVPALSTGDSAKSHQRRLLPVGAASLDDPD